MRFTQTQQEAGDNLGICVLSHRSYGNGDINSYISAYMKILKKLNSPFRFTILGYFQNQEYQFTILEPRTRLTEKQEEGEEEEEGEHRQLQIFSVSGKHNKPSLFLRTHKFFKTEFEDVL